MAGPLATMILADYGADVIRVEPPEGDPGWDEPNALLLNRGKKSIGLDLDTAAGQAEVRRLVSGMDVVLETMGPGRADQAGVGYEALSAVNPALIYCSITGFGPTGPFAEVKPDDALVMAKAGIFRDQPGWHQEDEHGRRRPVFRASPDGSCLASMLAVQGILAALRPRDLTGEGQLVETSLLAGLTCRQNPIIRWLLRDGEELAAAPQRRGSTSGTTTSPITAILARSVDGHVDRVQGRAVAAPHAGVAAVLPGVDPGTRLRVDLGGRAVRGRAAPVPRSRRRGRARPPHRGPG